MEGCLLAFLLGQADQRGLMFLGQTNQARLYRRAEAPGVGAEIEHDQAEAAAAQQRIGGACEAPVVGDAHDDQRVEIDRGFRDIGRVERTGVPGDPDGGFVAALGFEHELEGEGQRGAGVLRGDLPEAPGEGGVVPDRGAVGDGEALLQPLGKNERDGGERVAGSLRHQTSSVRRTSMTLPRMRTSCGSGSRIG